MSKIGFVFDCNRKVQCHKDDEMLTVDGECLTSSEIHEWCNRKYLDTTFQTKPAFTAHGTVECECSNELFAYWPLDGKCHEVYKQGPCKEGQMLVFSGGARLRRSNGLECVLNPCENAEEVPWTTRNSTTCHGLCKFFSDMYIILLSSNNPIDNVFFISLFIMNYHT